MDSKSHRPLSSRSVSASSHKSDTDSGNLFHRPVKPLKPRHAGEIPNRYVVKEDESGAYLSCLEAPELKVRITKDLAVTAAAARKAPEGTIFLDGAAQAAPFLDLERRVYNLDHHEEIVRPFTLSTCEQALVLVARGLDLREKPWEIQANEPDLDTLLAIWVLLNSMHLQIEDGAIREAVIPLVRLEGVIDSHGLELAELTGFPEDLLAATKDRLDRLHATEMAAKENGAWEEDDFVGFVAAQLQALDRMIYPADFFEAFRGIEELAKVELSDNRIAVVCRCDCGIYELEKELKRLYGKRLGVVVLDKGDNAYTLRQVDPFLPVNLRSAYQKLNVLDPAVTASGSADRWGGSGEIGGSPRKSGTALSPADIADALRLAYLKPSTLAQFKSALVSVAVASVPMLAGWTMVRLLMTGGDPPARSVLGGHSAFLAAALAITLMLALLLGRRGRQRVFGLQWPEGYRWLVATPALIVAAVFGGAWLFWPVGSPPYPPRPPDAAMWLCLLGFPLLAELVFRGLAHGVMVHNFSIQHSAGRWFLSWPITVSAMLYALWTLSFWPFVFATEIWPRLSFVSVPLSAFVFGLGLGVVRERSGSLVASLVLHYVVITVILVISALLG